MILVRTMTCKFNVPASEYTLLGNCESVVNRWEMNEPEHANQSRNNLPEIYSNLCLARRVPNLAVPDTQVASWWTGCYGSIKPRE